LGKGNNNQVKGTKIAKWVITRKANQETRTFVWYLQQDCKGKANLNLIKNQKPNQT